MREKEREGSSVHVTADGANVDDLAAFARGHVWEDGLGEADERKGVDLVCLLDRLDWDVEERTCEYV